MDSDSPSSSSLVQVTPQSALQQHPSISRTISQIDQLQSDFQPPDNTSEHFQTQSSVQISGTKSEQSEEQPKSDYTYALEAEIVCLQSEMLSKNKTIHALKDENENLKIELANFRECFQIMLKLMKKQQDEEKEVDRKGKKVVEIDEPERNLKKLFICTKKGTSEVLNVLALSYDSDDSDSDNDITIQEQSDNEEDDARIKSVVTMSRLEGIGSSSKMGSKSVEVGDIIQSKSGNNYALSNDTEIEKLDVLDENKPFFKEPLMSELASWDEKFYRPIHNEGLKLVVSSKSASPSCQTVLPPDSMNSKSTTSTPEIVKSSENDAKSMHRKRKQDACWQTEEEMLCALKEEMLLEAVCALFRQEWKMYHSKSSKRILGLSDTDFGRLMHVAKFLMEQNVNGPNRKTTEELERYIKDGVNFCAMLVGTYSRQLFQIYTRGMDDHFC